MFGRLFTLARHSLIYGLGSVVSRVLAVLLLPLYTRYLHPSDYGKIETLVALSAVVISLVQTAMKSAFFRFYFDSSAEHDRLRVLRTTFWYIMTSATACLAAGLIFADSISQVLFGTTGNANLVRAAAVGMWAQMNYEQLTNLFRVEQRSLAYVSASLVNIFITVGATVVLVVGLGEGALGVIVGSFIGTLVVYLALLGYRRAQLGLRFDRALFWRMMRFGTPLVPSALALWALNFVDRFLLIKMAGAGEVGLYSIGVRLASAMVLFLTAFRTAWPAFAYSIKDDREAKRTYAFVLTYLLFTACWLALGLGLLAPWLVRLLTTPSFYGASEVVPLLAFAVAAFGGYVVLAIGLSRTRRNQFNWVVTGLAAALNIGLNVILIPPYGMMGAAVATVAGYVAMFACMAWWSQRIFPAPYQWRRIVTLAAVAVGLVALGKALAVSLPIAIVLTVAYPLALRPLGFYLPAERKRMRALRRRLQPRAS
jgi:O-antigen/teichoic acid export membrane protein